jgi:hypothetical protein
MFKKKCQRRNKIVDGPYDDKYKIDLIYKNLDYVSKAYFSTEQIFPLWEAIYALIVGQLLVAFFTGCKGYREEIAVAGIIFSSIWFLVIKFSHFHSKDRTKKMEYLEDILEIEYNKIRLKLPGNSNFKFYKLKLNEQKSIDFLKTSRLYSTWFWRKCAPFLVFILWVYLLLVTYFTPSNYCR